MVVLKGSVENVTSEAVPTMKDVSRYFDFTFQEKSIVCRRAAGLGTGVEIFPTDIQQLAEFKSSILLPGGTDIPVNEDTLERFCAPERAKLVTIANDSQSEDQINEDGDGQEEEMDIFEDQSHLKERKIFGCPTENCSKRYLTQRHLDNHILAGSHHLSFSQPNTLERFKKSYVEKFGLGAEEAEAAKGKRYYTKHLEELAFSDVPADLLDNGTFNDIYPQGFALTKSRQAKAFTKKQKEYIEALFDQGQKTKNKFSPEEAYKKMKNARDSDGTLSFKFDEVLSEKQIKSLFGRLAQKVKYGDVEDATPEHVEAAIEVEEASEVWNALQSNEKDGCNTCPLMAGNVNLCSLSQDWIANGGRKTAFVYQLKVDFLQNICKKANIGISTTNKRSLGAAIKNYVTKSCPEDCLLQARLQSGDADVSQDLTGATCEPENRNKQDLTKKASGGDDIHSSRKGSHNPSCTEQQERSGDDEKQGENDGTEEKEGKKMTEKPSKSRLIFWKKRDAKTKEKSAKVASGEVKKRGRTKKEGEKKSRDEPALIEDEDKPLTSKRQTRRQAKQGKEIYAEENTSPKKKRKVLAEEKKYRGRGMVLSRRGMEHS